MFDGDYFAGAVDPSTDFVPKILSEIVIARSLGEEGFAAGNEAVQQFGLAGDWRQVLRDDNRRRSLRKGVLGPFLSQDHNPVAHFPGAIYG